MIPLIKSTFYKEKQTKAELITFIRSAKSLSIGEYVKRFETTFARKQKRTYAVMVNSGSSANLVLLQSLLNLGRIAPGSSVGFSALTWPTNVMPIIQLGLKPVALDCELATLNVSSRILKTRIDDVDALFLTNVLGFCDDIAEIRKLCDERGILLIEDNCESLGSRTNGTLLGNFGIASTFSFYVGHHLSTIEGGMVCTDDRELYEMLVMTRAHGWDRQLSAPARSALRSKCNVDEFYGKYAFYDLAYNVRPTDIQGFIGTRQLRYWSDIVRKRQRNFRMFQRAVATNPHIHPIDVSHMDVVSNFAMPLVFRSAEAFEHYRRVFEANKIEIRPIIAGDMTEQPFYKKHVPDTAVCPTTAYIHRYGFYFGNNPELTDGEITKITKLLV